MWNFISWSRISKAVTWRLYSLCHACPPWPQPCHILCHTPWHSLPCHMKMLRQSKDFPDKEEMTKYLQQTLHTALHRWVDKLLLQINNSDGHHIKQVKPQENCLTTWYVITRCFIWFSWTTLNSPDDTSPAGDHCTTCFSVILPMDIIIKKT